VDDDGELEGVSLGYSELLLEAIVLRRMKEL